MKQPTVHNQRIPANTLPVRLLYALLQRGHRKRLGDTPLSEVEGYVYEFSRSTSIISVNKYILCISVKLYDAQGLLIKSAAVFEIIIENNTVKSKWLFGLWNEDYMRIFFEINSLISDGISEFNQIEIELEHCPQPVT